MSGPTRKDKQVLTATSPPEKKKRKAVEARKPTDDFLDELMGGNPLPPLKQEEEQPPTQKTEDAPSFNSTDDLLWIYKQLGGKKELLSMIKTDPDLKKDFMRMILKSGAVGEVKKAGKKAEEKGPQKKGFLLVMKGLEEKKDDRVRRGLMDGVNPLKEKSGADETVNDGDIRDQEEDAVVVEGLDG